MLRGWGWGQGFDLVEAGVLAAHLENEEACDKNHTGACHAGWSKQAPIN